MLAIPTLAVGASVFAWVFPLCSRSPRRDTQTITEIFYETSFSLWHIPHKPSRRGKFPPTTTTHPIIRVIRDNPRFAAYSTKCDVHSDNHHQPPSPNPTNPINPINPASDNYPHPVNPTNPVNPASDNYLLYHKLLVCDLSF